MKIIATTPTGFLVEVTKREAANLAGQYSEYEKGNDALRPGYEINASFLYEHRRKMDEEIKGRADVASRLRAAADIIDATMPQPQPPEDPAQQ